MKNLKGIAAMAVLAAVAAAGVDVNAEVRPASMIGDNMILPQNTDAKLWGTADPGEKVTVIPSWSGKKYETTADRTGEWSLAVATPEGSFAPMSLQIYGETGPARNIHNVLIGEVWLASGQSNMEMPLKGFDGCIVKDGFKEIAGSNAYADRVRFSQFPINRAIRLRTMSTLNGRCLLPRLLLSIRLWHGISPSRRPTSCRCLWG